MNRLPTYAALIVSFALACAAAVLIHPWVGFPVWVIGFMLLARR